jgi:hypothetical protein
MVRSCSQRLPAWDGTLIRKGRARFRWATRGTDMSSPCFRCGHTAPSLSVAFSEAQQKQVGCWT